MLVAFIESLGSRRKSPIDEALKKYIRGEISANEYQRVVEMYKWRVD